MDLSTLKFTKTHEWISVSADGAGALVGISDYAQESLGDVTYVELPKPGKAMKQGDVLATVESVKAASDIFAPAAGTVEAVNDVLTGTPEVINASPYEEGWICRLTLDAGSMEAALASGSLMDAAAYGEFCKGLSE
ncbi:MAG: glycine cleavage system protein GcvH [Spirochaetales bacterium]|nr:MAG: glycine cleavage system protein GcvH [Spirochaetales bacterium]